jgi:hypothetical protein
MTKQQHPHTPFWLGVLAVIATAAAGLLLFASPAAQALPSGAPAVQGYPTPTPTAVPLDLTADRIEVTQAVQDLNNSVRLVQDKRTFVRFHVRSSSGAPVTTARLTAQRGASSVVLSPINPGGTIAVRTAPDRGTLHHAFLFELPNGFKQGSVALTARVNPFNNPAESSNANNQVNFTAVFESVPRVNLVMYQIGYQIGATAYTPGNAHRDQMLSWLRRVYPLSDLRVWNRTLNYGAAAAVNGALTNPTCGTVNARLMNAKALDVIFRWFGWSDIPTSSHYYGMVSDGGGFMRGCAVNIPHTVASGPTGNSNWGWDFDGSYGDWYGGHELAHTYGRFHAMYCGAGGGAAYPYGAGNISPTATGSSALFGFDINTKAIYGPAWKDVMTYCANQWISDFTYEGLMTYFKANPVRADAGLVRIAAGDRLLIGGAIDPVTNETILDPIWRVPDVAEITPPTGGDYAIVLRGAGNQELARYAFTPIASEGGAAAIPGEREIVYLLISELVPFVEGTTHVVIEGPGSQMLATVAPGSSAPQVTLTAPNGGQVLDGAAVEVTWTASDPDPGDTLSYMIQYSPDGGQTWMVAAQNVTGNSFAVDSSNLVASSQARFRVWASDGLNSAFDDSDGDNTTPDHAPQVTILGPNDGAVFAFGETVALQGEGYDIDTGPLQGAALEWLSNRDGALGDGELLSLASLAAGEHTITLRTPDGQGGFVTKNVAITVLPEGQAPTVANALAVGPNVILLERPDGAQVAQIQVDNLNAGVAIPWTALTSEPWLQLSQNSGFTPDTVAVQVVGDLPVGQYAATITFGSNAPGVTAVEAPVSLTVNPVKVFLPAVNRQ